MAARGHFETFPIRDGEIGHPGSGRVAWRFVDDEGNVRAISAKGFEDHFAAAEDAAELVIAIRTSTYGQRFVAEIADAVIELER